MATLNLARLESELRTFRRQKRLQYSSIFPVVWQPLAKDASLAEGALISLLGQTASDFGMSTLFRTHISNGLKLPLASNGSDTFMINKIIFSDALK